MARCRVHDLVERHTRPTRSATRRLGPTRLEDPEPLGAAQARGRVALLGEPGLQRVATEVLPDDHHRTTLRPQPREPAQEELVERLLADPDRRVRPDLVV